ncbi:MAG: hypothetical protein R6X02_20575 [Enhygromyxa sp.]
MAVLSPKPPELQLAADDDGGDICRRVAGMARREAVAVESRRFFEAVAAALGPMAPRAEGRSCESSADALASMLARHVREPWARYGIERGLAMFCGCIDGEAGETARRCVASLVAEYIGWREPPDAFFHRAGSIIVSRSAADLQRLTGVTGSYARTPRPQRGERRLLAAVPRTASSPASERYLTVLGFAGDPPTELVRSTTEIPSLGSEGVIGGLSSAELGWLAEPGPIAVPVVGRALLWFPREADHDLRRLHLLLSSAV